MDANRTAWVSCLLLAAAAAAQTPYNGVPAELPGIIKPENYDEGGSGVAYYIAGEFSRNGNYTDFRPTETVSLENPGGVVQIGWFHSGSWIRYSFNATATGLYDVYLTYRCGSFDTPRQLTLDFGPSAPLILEVPYKFNDEGWSKIPQGEKVLVAQNFEIHAGPGMLSLTNSGSSDINLVGLEFSLASTGTRAAAPRRPPAAAIVGGARSRWYSVPGKNGGREAADAQGRILPVPAR